MNTVFCFSKNVIILYLFEEIYHPGCVNLSILKFLCKIPLDPLKDGHKIDWDSDILIYNIYVDIAALVSTV